MEIRLIDFTFFILRISIIIKKRKEYNLIINDNRYESLVIIDKRKRCKLETLNTLLSKPFNNFTVYYHYGLFTSLDQGKIIKDIINAITKHYKSIRIKQQKPIIILNKDYIISESQSNLIDCIIYNAKDSSNVDFYS